MKNTCVCIAFILLVQLSLFAQSGSDTIVSKKDTVKKTATWYFRTHEGVGLIRNKISPLLNLSLNCKWATKKERELTLASSTNYFFSKNNNEKYNMYPNTFVTIEFTFVHQKGRSGFGIGYLAISKGDYFEKNTFKIWSTRPIGPFICLKPELIITRDFQVFFPGVTITL